MRVTPMCVSGPWVGGGEALERRNTAWGASVRGRTVDLDTAKVRVTAS